MKKCVQKGSKVDEEGNLSGASEPEGHIPGVDQHARFQSGGLLPGEHPVAGIAVVTALPCRNGVCRFISRTEKSALTSDPNCSSPILWALYSMETETALITSSMIAT